MATKPQSSTHAFGTTKKEEKEDGKNIFEKMAQTFITLVKDITYR